MNDAFVSFRLPKKVREAIEGVVEEGYYMNLSDFFRTAIRNELTKGKKKEK